jgi:hypothetical protein
VKFGTRTRTRRVLGRVRVSVGFCKLVSFGGVSSFFRVFFGFQVHPRVKNETRTQTWFCASRVRIQVTGAKMHLNPHPSDTKPTGYLKPESELSSLRMTCDFSRSNGQFTESAFSYILSLDIASGSRLTLQGTTSNSTI